MTTTAPGSNVTARPAPRSSLTYALVTPARNEQAFIEQTIRSVINQTIRPVKWVIVSDGSTDDTDRIVRAYAAKHDWIELLRMPDRTGRHFAAKARAFHAGYARLQGLHYDVVGNLDADISFEPEYFAFLLDKFEQMPRLGVAGTPFVETGFRYNYKFVSLDHVSGACQLFRRACFENVGGYTPIRGGGIDLVAVTTARMKGWTTRTFTEKTCLHHRKIGRSAAGMIKAKFNVGQQDYYLGGHPLWEVCRALYQMTLSPYVLGGSLILAGYLWAGMTRRERPIAQELINFRRKEQLQRLESRIPLLHLFKRARRIIDARVFKKWGSPATKKAIWDGEFARGQWDYLDHTAGDLIYAYLHKYSKHGSILDLGCGSSNTGNEIDVSAYRHYTGVDISEKAIEKAHARTLGDRKSKNEYVCADLTLYVPKMRYDVILFRESIFYIPVSRIKGVLERYAPSLTPGGVFIVRMCDRRKYGGIVQVIGSCREVIEASPSSDPNIVLVFR
jgi:glycosyltransferase involved in cell wall biosynthesis